MLPWRDWGNERNWRTRRSEMRRQQMDIRNIFKEISEQLLSEFRKTAEVNHPGGKGDLREDSFRKFLSDYLPKRYAVGRGEVITPENRVSGELDIVIYDTPRPDYKGQPQERQHSA